MQAPRLIRYLQSSLWALGAIVAVALGCNDPSVAAPRQRIDAQAIHARQPQLLKETLAKIKPTARDRPQLYFVGVAGFGSQAVFMREVRAVRELFDRRFGTLGRSIALINHESTLHDVPLATIVNLEHVLLHLGQRVMDADRDTLFLFMTSHGEAGEFAIQMPRIALAQLTPVRLKLMLDRSGIRNRVIVISACHSGSFISALADAHTLVMTAARADRSSFGCEDQRRWTYFGDAYFNRALREESSFTRAFANAKRTIRLWEAAERLKPSLPQIAGGEALGPALAAVGHD
jgi:hypothetical protein